MQQAKLVGSSPMSSSPVLHPTVQRALSNLDSRLEDELSRYRRYRAGLKVSPSSVQVLHPKPKPKSSRLELASFVPLTSPEPPSGTTATLDRDNGLDSMSEGPRSSSIAPLPIGATHDPAVDPSELTSELTAVDHAPEDYLESSEELLRSLAEEEAQAEAERGILENLLTPFGVGSMLLMLLASGMFGYLVMNPNSLRTIAGAVSRSISALRPQPQPVAQVPQVGSSEPPSSQSFALESPEFADFGLNNLTALRSSGPPILAPGATGKLGPNLPAKTPTTLGITIGAGMQPPTGNTAPSATSNPTSSPSLFGRNTPSSTRSQAPSPAPSRSSASSIGSGYSFSQPSSVRSASRSATPQRSYRPPVSVQSEIPPAPPAALPPVSPSLPTIAPSPTPTNEYKVVVPYDSDRTLEKAQQLDSGAFFRNGSTGAVIQMGGSYNSEAEAQQKVQELKQQGFEAEVQK